MVHKDAIIALKYEMKILTTEPLSIHTKLLLDKLIN